MVSAHTLETHYPCSRRIGNGSSQEQRIARIPKEMLLRCACFGDARCVDFPPHANPGVSGVFRVMTSVACVLTCFIQERLAGAWLASLPSRGQGWVIEFAATLLALGFKTKAKPPRKDVEPRLFKEALRPGLTLRWCDKLPAGSLPNPI